MSTQDTLAAVATAVKDTVLDSVHAVSQAPIVQDSMKEIAQAVASKGPTTGDLIAQMGLFQFVMILAAFGVVAVLAYLAIGVHRIADLLTTGSSFGGASKASAPASAPQSAPLAPASIHPGLSDEKLAVLLAVAAAEIMGQHVNIVKFRTAGNKDWTWAHQGRVDLHTRRL